MTTEQVANRWRELCNQGDFETCMKELYSHECESIEPAGGDWPEYIKGAEAMAQKGEMFYSMVEEFHSCSCSEPVISDNFFSSKMTMDITFKGAPRNTSSELCIFEVKDGKIVKEQFFYPIPPKQ